ncbi:unnamed protein product [Closterium sp. NIES-54]
MRNSGRKETKLKLSVLEDLQGKNRSTPKERRTSRATHQVSGGVKVVGRGKASDSGKNCRDRRQRCSRVSDQRGQNTGDDRTRGTEVVGKRVVKHSATVPAPAAAPVAPLPSPAAATGTPALPSPNAAVTPLLYHAVSVTAPAAAGGTPALPSRGAAVTPPPLPPAAAAAAAAAASVPSQTAHAPPSPSKGDADHG